MDLSLPQSAVPRSINYLILALTTRCNLRCRYCYHGDSQRQLNMDSATLERAFARAASGSGPLHIQLTGGEPCLVPHLIEEACGQAKQLSRTYTMGLQSNGTCLTPRVIDLIRTFGLQVGISLDGSPRIQQSLRGQAAETLRGLMLLEAEQIPFRVTTVVNNENVGQLDRLAWLLSAFRQARGIGLDLLVKKDQAGIGEVAPIPATARALTDGIRSLIKALIAINKQRELPLRLREWDLVRRMLRRDRDMVPRIFCQAAQGASLAVHPDGRWYPCNQTLGDERFVIDPEANQSPILLTASLQNNAQACGDCPLSRCCPNDCPSRLLYNPPSVRALACTLYQTLAYASLADHQDDPSRPLQIDSYLSGDDHAVFEIRFDTSFR